MCGGKGTGTAGIVQACALPGDRSHHLCGRRHSQSAAAAIAAPSFESAFRSFVRGAGGMDALQKIDEERPDLIR